MNTTNKSGKMKFMERWKLSAHNRRQNIVGYCFMLPWLIGFIFFTGWPFFYSIYLSFFHVVRDIAGWHLTWVGLDNYHLSFFRNPSFTPALLSFLWMQITYVPAITVIAFILALLLNQKIKFRGWFRALFFLPVIVMSGPVMHQLRIAGGLSGIDIRGIPLFWMVVQFSFRAALGLELIFNNFATLLWFTGIPIVIMLSGLQKIDTGIIEAARIDSATAWQILWKITIPIIRPIILVSTILTIVQIAAYTENPILPMIQDNLSIQVDGLGLASTFAWIYAAVVLLLIGIAYSLLKSPKDVVPPAEKRRARAWNER